MNGGSEQLNGRRGAARLPCRQSSARMCPGWSCVEEQAWVVLGSCEASATPPLVTMAKVQGLRRTQVRLPRPASNRPDSSTLRHARRVSGAPSLARSGAGPPALPRKVIPRHFVQPTVHLRADLRMELPNVRPPRSRTFHARSSVTLVLSRFHRHRHFNLDHQRTLPNHGWISPGWAA